MENLLKTMAQAVVNNPENVNIQTREEEDKVVLELRVAAEDMGKVIGKQGRIAKAIRTVIKAANVNNEKKIFVEILE